MSVFLFSISGLPALPELAALDKTLALVYGSAFFGVGLGMVIKVGGSTGGSDMLGNYISTRFHVQRIAGIIFCIDASVILLSAIVFRSISAPLYAFLASFLSAKVMDYIVEGKKASRAYYIFSDKHKEIADALLHGLGRGVSGINTTGMYTNQERKMLLCIVLPAQIPLLRGIVMDIDAKAFIFGTNVHETFGQGFADIHEAKAKKLK
jgi:uncharacterized membrane-anchored protein YitT (DUF2179 family)